MKLTTSITSLLALFCVQSSLLAQDEAKKEVRVQPKVITKSIQANDKGAEGADIVKAIEEKGKVAAAGGANFMWSLSVEPDKEGDPKVKKNIDKDPKNAQNLKNMIFIGVDGKVIELENGEGVSDAIHMMMKKISSKDGNVMKVGPAFFNGLGSEMKKEMDAIKKEQAEQRKLLEAILEKLK